MKWTNKYGLEIWSIERMSIAPTKARCYPFSTSDYWCLIKKTNTWIKSCKSKEFGPVHLQPKKKKPPELFCEKRYSWKFRKFHKKKPVLESLLIKLQAFRPSDLADLQPDVAYPVKFTKFLRTYFEEHLRRKTTWK